MLIVTYRYTSGGGTVDSLTTVCAGAGFESGCTQILVPHEMRPVYLPRYNF